MPVSASNYVDELQKKNVIFMKFLAFDFIDSFAAPVGQARRCSNFSTSFALRCGG